MMSFKWVDQGKGDSGQLLMMVWTDSAVIYSISYCVLQDISIPTVSFKRTCHSVDGKGNPPTAWSNTVIEILSRSTTKPTK